MKCQILFSGKNKKNIINLSSAENDQRVVKVKHHSETHIITSTVMKQRKRLKGNLKPEHKKTTNRTTMGPTTDLDSRHHPF